MTKEQEYLLTLPTETTKTNKLTAFVKKHSKLFIIGLCFTTIVAIITILLLNRKTTQPPTQSLQKAQEYVPAWETCYPGGLGCQDGYNCCVGPDDVTPGLPFSSNKYTCRDFSSCLSSTPNQVVKGWETCYAGNTCEDGFVCCLGVGDRGSGKLTCRLDGKPLNDNGGCSGDITIPTRIIKKWETCQEGNSCEEGYTCCTAPSDILSGKRTCRLQGLSNNDPSGCAVPSNQSPPSNQLPSGFRGKNVGIGSFFFASLSSDSTNGRSWCGYSYKDWSNGFAPDLSVMTDGTNAVYTGSENNWESSATKYCGLEALVTNPATGVSKIMYIIDAFDPRWVRTPGSIDIMAKSWEELAGRPANDKNVVIQDVTWEFTGGRSLKYSFNGGGDP